jgi:hypothetical protein
MTADAITQKLSDAARQLLERYLWELRISLQGCRSVDPKEVEADVKQHIDQELADAPAPVSGDKLDEVLRKLGSPWQWVPVEELSWWRRIVLKLRTGPNDLRLGALVMALMVLGLIFVPLTWPFLLGSFLLARATVAMMAEREKELGWQRWLIYPPLVIVYLPIFLALIAWPAMAAALAAELGGSRDISPFNGQPWRDLPEIPFILSATATAISGWWSLLLAAVLIWPALPMHVFRPFIGRVRRAVALLLLIVCLVIFGFSAVALSDIVNYQARRTPPPYQPPAWEQQQPQRPDGTQGYRYRDD